VIARFRKSVTWLRRSFARRPQRFTVSGSAYLSRAHVFDRRPVGAAVDSVAEPSEPVGGREAERREAEELEHAGPAVAV